MVDMTLPVESVWDFPRPPRIERVDLRLVVSAFGKIVADTNTGYRILETSHPPTYYIPNSDVALEFLIEGEHSSYCEFKGRAAYFSISTEGKRINNAAWSYPEPTSHFSDIANHLSFYASDAVQCWVGNEPVISQPGNFYGGWITKNLRGPFKGVPGSRFW